MIVSRLRVNVDGRWLTSRIAGSPARQVVLQTRQVRSDLMDLITLVLYAGLGFFT